MQSCLWTKYWIEIELGVKGREWSQDKDMLSRAHCCTEGDGPGVSTFCFKNVLCTLELCLEPVKKKTAQATILGCPCCERRRGSWPFKYGGLVACSPQPRKFVLSDSRLMRTIIPFLIQPDCAHSVKRWSNAKRWRWSCASVEASCFCKFRRKIGRCHKRLLQAWWYRCIRLQILVSLSKPKFIT
jgi:hypothetical protein